MGISKDSFEKSYDFKNYLNNVTIKFDEKITSCANMFYGLQNIIEIDLSSLDISNVKNMSSMFEQCINLKKITFGNINTSLVENMHHLFHNCTKLISLDLSNFDTSSVTNMQWLFRFCESITSIDLTNFNTGKVEDMFDIFAYCYKLTSVDVSSFETSKVKQMQGMFYHCYALKYLDLSKFDTSQVATLQGICADDDSLIYINFNSLIIKEGTIIDIDYMFDNTSPDLKICINDSFTRNILSKYESKFDCNNLCFGKNIKIDLKENKCVQNCNESEFKYEYNHFCYETCPNKTFTKENEFLCLNKAPEGYYLDSINSLYKKCFSICQTCSESGNNLNNNCIKCKSVYIDSNGTKNDFLYELIINNYKKNCYTKCPHYYYTDNDTNIKYCTQNSSCPYNYTKLIKERNECVNKCGEKGVFRYEFNNICYEDCPEGSLKREKDDILTEYFCKPNCTEEDKFELILSQKCVKNCPLKELREKTCILNYKGNKEEKEGEQENKKDILEEEIEAQNMMLQNLEIGFTSEDYDTSDLDNGQDDVFGDEKMTVTFTTTNNQKNNTNNNMTVIDLGECEQLLRTEYGINKSGILYMKKIDVNQEGMKIPRVEYDVYAKINGSNLIKLNLSICQNSIISLSVPAKITESLDKLNSSSAYYNDLCYTASSDRGTDISLTDRKKEFVEGNKTLCQDGCEFSDYDYTNQKAKCSCKVKESAESIADMKINKSKLYENFVDIKNIANIKLMTCFKVLFTYKGIQNNVACFITIPVIIFHIVAIIMFYANQKEKIQNKINDISFGINNWDLVKEVKRKKRLERIMKKKEKKLKKIRNKRRNKKKDRKIEEIKILNSNDYNDLDEIIGKGNPPNKKKRKIKFEINNNNKNTINNNIIVTNNNKKNKKRKENKTIDNQEITKRAKEIMVYDDEEKNDLSYKLAKRVDKRNYFQYYISLLKAKHILIFSFFNNSDYNSRIIKIDLFFIGFIIYFTVNALFFNDDTMHKIYEDEGSFNFIYQLPQIIYSSIISAVFNILLKLLALSEGNILEYKKNKEKINLEERTSKLKNKLSIKFILYFIISFIFLFLFWYYLAMFCAIYTNTQNHLIQDTLISLVYTLYILLGFIYYLDFSEFLLYPNAKIKENVFIRLVKYFKCFNYSIKN